MVALRAAYTTLALAAVGSAIVGAIVLAAAAPTPVTVRAALGLGTTDPPDLAARRAEAVARRTAECMRSRGLPYVPVAEPPPPIPDAELDPVAWADRWGFGVSTSVARGPLTGPRDPNAEHAQHLPPAEREAYRLALFGADGASGCHGSAAAAVYGLRDRLLAPLRSELADMERAIDADPRMAVVHDRWRACVGRATAGLGLDTADLDRSRLAGRLLDTFATRIRALEDHRGALAAAQAVERRVAGGVARCERAFTADRGRVAGVHEARFVRRHGERLERIGRAIRDAEAGLPDPAR